MSMAGRLGGQMNRMRMGGYGTTSALPMSGGIAPEGVSTGLAAMMAPGQAPAVPGVQPVALPKIQRPGVAGFAERFVNPDPTTPGGALTLAARYAGAGFGDPVSTGLLQMDRDQQLQERQAAQDEVQQLNVAKARRELTQPEYLKVGDSIVSVDPETRAFSEVYRAPTPEPEPTTLMRNWDWFNGLSSQDQVRARPMLPGFGFTPEAQQARVSTAGAVADAQGAARARYREAKVPGGSAVRVTSVAQARSLPKGTRFIDPNGVERIVP